ncbi:MAG: restriction endonuclease subunit M [Candidatus Parabeggiatoa sp. nov. 3]|nr:MAG: restriction endonuclease subunit M [Gammaproteobacteria bacterium]RKZ64991.1 MAG: restriction endonuclease subunit M [Gammaproteobacteria bacterium]
MHNTDQIQNLTERFCQKRESDQLTDYNEAETRIDFINPFFSALGWDIENKQKLPESYREVVYEDRLKIDNAPYKHPDYSFRAKSLARKTFGAKRVGGVRKFFVEAKKPSISLSTDSEAAYQIRRYGWNAKLSLSILTNFAELAVYDCRIKPEMEEAPSIGRVWYLKYTDYLEHWEELVERFSIDAVWQGKFDHYAAETATKKGAIEVDTAFLNEMETWREKLAHHIISNNTSLTQRQLNSVVQQTIDRIIFLRIAEDRGIEDYGRLLALTNGSQIYKRLFELFNQADERYNSCLFHFRKEKGREAPDTLTPSLKIGDEVLKNIIQNLYYPISPYEFSVLPADILGQVYERFLGKVIRLTPQVVIEEKPEVKKAGGVYYTPRYIVDYIVKQSVGQILESAKIQANGLSNKLLGNGKLSSSRLKILDPACGSGSFLLGAYQFLLDWHLEQYLLEPKKWMKGKKQRLYQAIGGTWKLTLSERKRILLNNIYGVDIDPQAVEVTKLSLLLKVLEDENSVISQLSFFKKRVLPDINNNIKCGNSLIGQNFYQGQQLTLIDEETQYRINAFDWESEFSQVMEAGGFDAVIGNPPYGAWFQSGENGYFCQKYHVFKGVKDVYTCFLEKGFNLLKEKGKLSFIVPSAWTGGPRYMILRSYILDKQIDNLVRLPFDVFVSAYVDTVIIVLSNKRPSNAHTAKTYVFGKRERLTQIQLDGQYQSVLQQDWRLHKDKKLLLVQNTITLIQRLNITCHQVIKNIAVMKRGVLFDHALLTDKPLSAQYYKYFEGNVYRYQIHVIADQWAPFGSQMKEKPKEVSWFQDERILLRRLVNRRQRLMAVIVEETFITNKNLYIIKMNDEKSDIRVLLGILNSRFISFFYLKQVTQATKNDFPQLTIKDILRIPFPPLSDDSSHQMVELVKEMLALNKQRAANNDPYTMKSIERRIEATDKQIDQVVYRLYDLTREEIEIVEKNSDW